MIGLSRNNVIRNLIRFVKDGIIYIDKNKIEIRDMDMLKKISRMG
ncbi:MAG: winged helix-turn-helix domain-containing protein [Bacteroidetes bacterium]|nr:winged helix-turn-helix domain-containing protein [Bacteroidota bacterium]